MIDGSQRRRIRRIAALGVGVLLAGLLSPAPTAQARPTPVPAPGEATFTRTAAFDVTAPMRDVARSARRAAQSPSTSGSSTSGGMPHPPRRSA
ncbi:hypothetical protein JNW88_11265 [Micromonospora sp. ATA32]|nr:hypothetical protein [Micromonospora sp. ATA32]